MHRYRVGRGETNDIVLAHATVSREHAEIVELGRGRFRITDLGSTFGTSILQGSEWAKVTEIEIGHDTKLRFGEHETTVADLLHDLDKTVVRPKAEPQASSAPHQSAQPALAAPAFASRTAPGPEPPPVADTGPPPPGSGAPPSHPDAGSVAQTPAAAARPALQVLSSLPADKRVLVWIAAAFGVFMLNALIVLILALAL